MTESTYRREDLFGAYSFRGMGVYHHHGKEHISKLSGLVIDQQLRSSLQILKQKAESSLGMT